MGCGYLGRWDKTQKTPGFFLHCTHLTQSTSPCTVDHATDQDLELDVTNFRATWSREALSTTNRLLSFGTLVATASIRGAIKWLIGLSLGPTFRRKPDQEQESEEQSEQVSTNVGTFLTIAGKSQPS